MSGSNERESWYRTEEPPRLVVYYDSPGPSRAATFVKGLKNRAGRVWRRGREKRGETSMSKPFMNWTPAEMKAECVKNDSPEKSESCLLREKGGHKRCLPAVIFQTSHHPCEWELDIECPMTEQELAICRAVGAKWVTRGIEWDTYSVTLWDTKPKCKDGHFLSNGGVPLGVLKATAFPSVNPGDCIEVPEEKEDA